MEGGRGRMDGGREREDREDGGREMEDGRKERREREVGKRGREGGKAPHTYANHDNANTRYSAMPENEPCQEYVTLIVIVLWDDGLRNKTN